jgi:hypothetical protein
VRLRSVGLCVLVSAALTGSASACAQSDPSAGDARAATPSPTPAAPASKVGNCYLNVVAISFPSSDLPMDCAKPHRAETFHVGTFTGEYASRSTPPPMRSPALRSAFDACDPVAKRLVGGDWRGGRLSIQVVIPGPPSWAGGSRWYRCDIFELDALEGGTHRQSPQDHAIERTGSLRDALTRRLPLVYTMPQDPVYLRLLGPGRTGLPALANTVSHRVGVEAIRTRSRTSRWSLLPGHREGAHVLR